MKHIVFLCLLLIFHVSVCAIEITIGTNQVTIPVPEGFTPVVDEMQPLATLAPELVVPDREHLALFLPKPNTNDAASNKFPERVLYVETVKALIPLHLTPAHFELLKQKVKELNTNELKKLESQVPGTFERINRKVSELYDLELDWSMVQSISLPPHYETERCLTYSTLFTSALNDENGKPEIGVEAVTTAIVLVEGKALYLFANGLKSDLEWTRSESLKWIEAIIAANPPVVEDAPPENTRRRSGKTLENMAAQILATVIIGIFVAAYKQRKRRLNG